MARWDAVRQVWRITATGYRPGEKRRRVVRSVAAPHNRPGRREAEAAETRLQAEVLEDLEAELPGGQVAGSFALAAMAWVDRHPRWSPKTVKETRYALRCYILPALGATRLNRVAPDQIEALYARWARDGFADSAMRRWHGIVRAIFTDAERLGQIRTSPMRRVRPAGGNAPERMSIPEPADVRRAIDAAASPAAALFFELAAGTGARRGTLVALRWRDLDLEAGTVTFRHAISVGEDGPVMKGTKANRPYAVHLTAPALDALRTHRAQMLESALALGVAKDLANLFVFSRDGGRSHWSVEYPSHAWRVACERAGVVGCRLHDLRHFSATHLLAAGVPYRVVAERLGCTETNVQKTYSHWVPTPEDARAAEVMTAALAQQSPLRINAS
jgi:integrase